MAEYGLAFCPISLKPLKKSPMRPDATSTAALSARITSRLARSTNTSGAEDRKASPTSSPTKIRIPIRYILFPSKMYYVRLFSDSYYIALPAGVCHYPPRRNLGVMPFGLFYHRRRADAIFVMRLSAPDKQTANRLHIIS